MKQPHLRSYERVSSVVTRDRALSKKLSGKTQRVELSNGKTGEYPKELVELVQVIHNNNLDAVTLSPGEILRYAMQYFGIIDGPLVLDKKAEKPAAAPAAVAPAAPKPAAKPKRPKRTRPAAKKPAPEDDTDAEPEPPSPVTPQEQETNQVDEPEPADEPVRDIIKLPKEWDKSMPYAPGLTICSLIVSALGLADAYDRGEGHAERTKELNAILIKFQRITTIPKSSAKEAVNKA